MFLAGKHRLIGSTAWQLSIAVLPVWFIRCQVTKAAQKLCTVCLTTFVGEPSRLLSEAPSAVGTSRCTFATSAIAFQTN